MNDDVHGTTAPISYFVLSRPLTAKHLPWRARVEARSFDAAASESTRLAIVRGLVTIETQVVASTALTAAEIARFRSQLTFAQAAARSEVPAADDATATGNATCARCGVAVGVWTVRQDEGGVRRAYHSTCAALHDREARLAQRAMR